MTTKDFVHLSNDNSIQIVRESDDAIAVDDNDLEGVTSIPPSLAVTPKLVKLMGKLGHDRIGYKKVIMNQPPPTNMEVNQVFLTNAKGN